MPRNWFSNLIARYEYHPNWGDAQLEIIALIYQQAMAFLDYFNLKSISQLPPLSELIDFETLEKQLGLQLPPMQADVAEPELLANITEPSEIMLTEEA